MNSQSNQDPKRPLIDLHPWPYLRNWESERLANGFLNTTNTCFLASTIQCLQHIPVWKNYLLQQHPRSCKVKRKTCFVCILKNLAELSFSGNNAVSPKGISENIDQIGANMREGLQEDAHEFLTCLFDKIQKNLTVRFEKLDPASEMTTGLGKIFGGYLRSQIVCVECSDTLNNFEEFFNVSLDIEGAESVEEAFQQFTASDNFNNSTWFHCEKCRKECRAEKRYTLNTLPEVLIIHLKRYSYVNNGPSKVQKFIPFSNVLNLAPFTSSHLATHDSEYQLNSVVVHKGMRLSSGHYYSYVKLPNTEQWFIMNDSYVSRTDWETVSKEQAYLLFYSKRNQSNQEKIMHVLPEVGIESDDQEAFDEDERLECRASHTPPRRTSFVGKIVRSLSLLKLIKRYVPYSFSKRTRNSEEKLPVPNQNRRKSDIGFRFSMKCEPNRRNSDVHPDENKLKGFGYLGNEYFKPFY